MRFGLDYNDGFRFKFHYELLITVAKRWTITLVIMREKLKMENNSYFSIRKKEILNKI